MSHRVAHFQIWEQNEDFQQDLKTLEKKIPRKKKQTNRSTKFMRNNNLT